MDRRKLLALQQLSHPVCQADFIRLHIRTQRLGRRKQPGPPGLPFHVSLASRKTAAFSQGVWTRRTLLVPIPNVRRWASRDHAGSRLILRKGSR
eukprot:scaffold34403_cov17-Prasinocladus_malaysianus.AAC.1